MVSDDANVSRVLPVERNLSQRLKGGVAFLQSEHVNPTAALEPVPEGIIDPRRIIGMKDFRSGGLAHPEMFGREAFEGFDFMFLLFPNLRGTKSDRANRMGAQIEPVDPGDRPLFAQDRLFVSTGTMGMAIGGIQRKAVEFRVNRKRIGGCSALVGFFQEDVSGFVDHEPAP